MIIRVIEVGTSPMTPKDWQHAQKCSHGGVTFTWHSQEMDVHSFTCIFINFYGFNSFSKDIMVDFYIYCGL